jgi:uncharacterized protein YndB with AHSA1/START domain
MAELFQMKSVNGVSDDSVRANTGRKLGDWYKILEKAGARMLDYREMRLHVQNTYGIPRWWSGMIVLGYQQERGLRQRHQRGGLRFEIDRSRTIKAPIGKTWAAWQDPKVLSQWMPPGQFEIRTAKRHKSMHLTWRDGTEVAVLFAARRGKTRVSVSHEKVTDTEVLKRLQDFWAEALSRLQSVVEP